MGTQFPSPEMGRSPQFSAHICCGQMAGWIKMPLGREVCLSPSDIVLYGDPAPLPQNGLEPPQLYIVPKRQDGSRCDLVRTYASAQATLSYIGIQLPQKEHSPEFSAHVYCGHGRPSQLLLSSCSTFATKSNISTLYTKSCSTIYSAAIFSQKQTVDTFQSRPLFLLVLGKV